jgi:hypothetical protein
LNVANIVFGWIKNTFTVANRFSNGVKGRLNKKKPLLYAGGLKTPYRELKHW